VGLVWAAGVMFTPGRGQSRTDGDLSVRAGLQRPGQEGVIRPLPCAYPGGDTFTGARIPRRRAA
jgi:hypothetical protein